MLRRLGFRRPRGTLHAWRLGWHMSKVSPGRVPLVGVLRIGSRLLSWHLFPGRLVFMGKK